MNIWAPARASQRSLVARVSPRAGRIGLAPASWPADVLPIIGRSGAESHFPNSVRIAAVLRSWQDLFGARLLELGFTDVAMRPVGDSGRTGSRTKVSRERAVPPTARE
jgi:hypothetical protein